MIDKETRELLVKNVLPALEEDLMNMDHGITASVDLIIDELPISEKALFKLGPPEQMIDGKQYTFKIMYKVRRPLLPKEAEK